MFVWKFIVGGVFVLPLFLLTPSTIQAADTPSLSLAQRKEMQELLADFRRHRNQPEERKAVIDQLATIGPLAVNAAAEVITKEIFAGLIPYRQAFTNTAAQAFSKKVSGNNGEEITQLRAKILELTRGDNLTKEQIVQISDPALERLKELLLVQPDDVLASNQVLPKSREALLQQGLEWDYSQQKLQELAQAAASDAADIKAENLNPVEPVVSQESSPSTFSDYLAQEEELAIFAAMPFDAATRQTLFLNKQLASQFEPEEVSCMQDANLIRTLLGLKVLAFDPLLGKAARSHSADMKKLNFFAHSSPVPGKTTPWDRAKLAGTSASAENIAAGVQFGVKASRMWWHSPGHHRNMLGEHARIGVGRQEEKWTQMFGG